MLNKVFILFVASFFIYINSSLAIDIDNARPSLRANYNSKSCSELLTECFTLDKIENKGACLSNASTNVFCFGGSLGELALQRSKITSSSNNNEPTLFDLNCLKNFDNQISASLIQGNISEQSITQLLASLNKCIKTAAPDVFRP
jgi:hypothetical protein